MTEPPSKPPEGTVDAIYRQIRANLRASDGEVVPRRAAACVLWRKSSGGAEFFLARRGAGLAFMPGNWVFPGGAVEAADATSLVALRREVVEEIGVSLPDNDQNYVRLAEFVTPKFSPIRFVAEYFLIEAPAGIRPDHRVSGGELDAAQWLTALQALQRYDAAQWLIPSPVRRVLECLVDGVEGAAQRCGRAAQIENAAPRVWDLAPGIAVIPLRTLTLPPATHTNCYVIGCGETIVIDPGTSDLAENGILDDALAELARHGRHVREIWLTHHHLDHVAGAALLAKRLGVPIAAHPATAARVSPDVRVDRCLQDGEVIELAGTPARRVRALFTPGHAAGHMCFVEETTRFAVVGDMVAGVGTILIDPDEGNMAEYLESLRLLKRLDPAVLLPAHGGAISAVQDKLEHYLEHRLWREQQVIDALTTVGRGTSAALVSHAYADVPPSVHGIAERSLRSHLHKLLAEHRVAVDNNQWQLTNDAKLI